MADPNLKVCPDYQWPEFDDVWLVFTLNGKTKEEAVVLLRNIWGLNNARAIENWQHQCMEEAEAERQCIEFAEQEAEQQWALHKEEKVEAKREERKKYKNKFTPISNRPLSDATLILPPQHALTKLCKGDYVPLYLFTNKGIWEAEKDGSGDEDLLTLVQTDKGPTFQSSVSVKAKKHKVKDKVLSLEEFSQANFRMLNAMHQQEWAADLLEMVRNFWIAIETHNWQHDPSKYCQCTLLVYQDRIHKDWHKMLTIAQKVSSSNSL